MAINSSTPGVSSEITLKSTRTPGLRAWGEGMKRRTRCLSLQERRLLLNLWIITEETITCENANWGELGKKSIGRDCVLAPDLLPELFPFLIHLIIRYACYPSIYINYGSIEQGFCYLRIRNVMNWKQLKLMNWRYRHAIDRAPM